MPSWHAGGGAFLRGMLEKIGDDAAGKLQVEEMQREGVDSCWITAPGCMSQSSYILVDELSGERTVLWEARSPDRDPPRGLAPGVDLRGALSSS